MIIWHDVEQGSPEWHALRKPLWTGSRAIRLLQGKPFMEEAVFAGNNATRRGHMLEVVALREYERKYGRKVQRPGFVTNTIYSNAGYSPDAIDGGWLLECKAFSGVRHEDLVAEKIPLTVQVQIFFGMIITGKRKARLLAYNPEVVGYDPLTVIEITYDKLIGNNIRSKLRLDMKKRRSI
ncbi:MAG: YqaJ viral recombinase family protein [Pseudomonadota bacterium]